MKKLSYRIYFQNNFAIKSMHIIIIAIMQEINERTLILVRPNGLECISQFLNDIHDAGFGIIHNKYFILTADQEAEFNMISQPDLVYSPTAFPEQKEQTFFAVCVSRQDSTYNLQRMFQHFKDIIHIGSAEPIIARREIKFFFPNIWTYPLDYFKNEHRIATYLKENVFPTLSKSLLAGIEINSKQENALDELRNELIMHNPNKPIIIESKNNGGSNEAKKYICP